jgi:MOSC domain-containing protein YiiM
MSDIATSPRHTAAPSRLVTLLSVNVALPVVIGRRHRQRVESGIHKRPLSGDSVELDTLNLAGDRQADLVAHGGPDKAVYAYPSEHLPLWTAELKPDAPYGPGAFGENLTVGGWREGDVYIGDIWAWGDALLQVAQPRYPCYKLGIAINRPSVVKKLVASGRCGWYFRVLRPGHVPLAGPVEVAERDPAAITVTRAFLARIHDLPREEAETIAAVPALAEKWRRSILERLKDEERG